MAQRITPFLWFDDKAEEAATPTGRPPGSVMAVEFQLDGQDFVALNGGLLFKFTEAISFVVNCDTQEEVDYFWSKLSAGGEESRNCYFSWQRRPEDSIPVTC
ncbi:MAG TPA: VOC family protein [Candidatus Udaeobacter sp.]|nr:VOC family protein [Candidatus Udaeobacter sp.]